MSLSVILRPHFFTYALNRFIKHDMLGKVCTCALVSITAIIGVGGEHSLVTVPVAITYRRCALGLAPGRSYLHFGYHSAGINMKHCTGHVMVAVLWDAAF